MYVHMNRISEWYSIRGISWLTCSVWFTPFVWGCIALVVLVNRVDYGGGGRNLPLLANDHGAQATKSCNAEVAECTCTCIDRVSGTLYGTYLG